MLWLESVALAGNDGFSPRELNRIWAVILEHLQPILEARDEHCGE